MPRFSAASSWALATQRCSVARPAGSQRPRGRLTTPTGLTAGGGWRSAAVESTGFIPAFGRTGGRIYTGWARAGLKNAYKRAAKSRVRAQYRSHMKRSYRWQAKAYWLDAGINTYDTARYGKTYAV